MPIVYSNTIKTARSAVVITALGSAGVLVIGTAALAGGGTGVLASIPLDNPAFSNVNGLMTMTNPPRTVNASGAGTAAKAELRDNGGTVIASGLTVGLSGSGADVIINSTSISVGQSVQATIGTITPTS
ncbi:hypothetical protein EVB41_009 [Rhizobium phage RHph_TM3_14A]|nr:hypothetical protein EVB29_009 [Rhizobium phage RHph_TM27A]QIG66929.1 hypothetical protein EVB30_009 [Rhizobium phage RHph_TM27B]QIG67019.1 hypothetical protein EVB31_009 [Rhizobium phage RHph_TM29]QIG67474.1 hypothetical protein EVB41_009 [Rhizobium phage RHph_TM3_14A]